MAATETTAYVSAFDDNGTFTPIQWTLDGGGGQTLINSQSLQQLWITYDALTAQLFFAGLPPYNGGPVPGPTLGWLTIGTGVQGSLSSDGGCVDGTLPTGKFAFSPYALDGLTVDGHGDIIFLDASGCTILGLHPLGTTVTTLLGGSCDPTCSVASPPACQSNTNVVSLCGPQAVAVGGNGDLYFADAIDLGTSITIEAYDFLTGSIPATLLTIALPANQYGSVQGLAVDAQGNVFFTLVIANGAGQYTGGALYLLPVGSPSAIQIAPFSSGHMDGALSAGATVGYLYGVALLPSGELLFTDDGDISNGIGAYQGLRELACQ